MAWAGDAGKELGVIEKVEEGTGEGTGGSTGTVVSLDRRNKSCCSMSQQCEYNSQQCIVYLKMFTGEEFECTHHRKMIKKSKATDLITLS